MDIVLTGVQMQILSEAMKDNNSFFIDLKENKFDGMNWKMSFKDAEIDEIRDICIERQQIIGFDENYRLTKDGKILQALIDLLLIT